MHDSMRPIGVSKQNVAGTQSVYRAIAILRGVARHNEDGITAKRLAEEIDLTLGTTHRLLSAFVDEGLLTVDHFTRKYHLGLEIYQMGSAARIFYITQFMESTLQKLRDFTGETVFLLIRSGRDSLCLRRVDGTLPLHALTLLEGSRRPLGVGAGGLALLAAQPEPLCSRIVAGNLETYQEYFDLDADDLHRAIAMTRLASVSLNTGQVLPGVRAVGMAAGPETNPGLCAVSIASTDRRMTATHQRFLEDALRAELGQIDWTVFEIEQQMKGETS